MIATTFRTFTQPLSRLAMFAALLAGLGVLMPAPASAVSANVRNACMSDYFSFCAGMEVGSAALRRCFNRNGSRLSTGCVNALVSAGEVSKAEVDRRSGKSKVASRKSGKRVASKSARRQYATLR